MKPTIVLCGVLSALIAACSSNVTAPAMIDAPLDKAPDGGAASDAPAEAMDAPAETADGPLDADASGDLADASPCPAGQILRYVTAGCGTAAQPVCGSAIQDACARQACGCDGKTMMNGCNFYDEPWSHLGPCEGADASDAGDASDAIGESAEAGDGPEAG